MPSRHHRLASLTKQLTSHVNAGRHRDAITLFSRMLSAPDLPPLTDPSFAHAFPLGIKSANALRVPRTAASFHALAAKCALLSSPFLSSALIASYGSSHSPAPALARRLFDELPARNRNAVVWSAMISVHVWAGDLAAAATALDLMDVAPTASCFNTVIAAVVESGDHPARAIEVYRHMRRVGVAPSFITLLALVPACTAMGTLSSIREVHGFAVRHGMSRRSHIGSSLIEAYGRCGFLAGAQRVFDQVQDRDVVVWSSLVSAYAFHGHAEVAMSLFRHMEEQDDVRPDGIMFLSLLAACAHAGHADDALQYFDVLTKRYGVEACGDHYSCLVDVLGRAGRLHQAYEVIRTMPVKVTAKAWGALLAACRKYGEVRLAEVAGRALFDIEPENAGNFVSLANIYSGMGMHEEAEQVRRDMEQRGVQRLPGSSWMIHRKSSFAISQSAKGLTDCSSAVNFYEKSDKVSSVITGSQQSLFRSAIAMERWAKGLAWIAIDSGAMPHDRWLIG
ncbi:putative pentatricopeptide repeat-containing protein At1g03510 isoform X3 [Phragmites australis]|uniref:putative pentatricopeptide repeat-containing protein At1g03510 isoform X3 n=1 Tax=Phragmites australis TaxID=29695 RepID=UPI002D778AD0|nr:putative pentatricopeptide repeat-containing protein At1g03510 isoform X3 [Phragmites australis]XP_062213955.1 putative pentatricopeptide repeat-containing protein At1g03510 isoform X3 [Phragmites australis]